MSYAVRTLSQEEVKTAIKEFVEREGWTVTGTPTISHSDGQLDGTIYSATASLEPPARKRGKGEG